MISFGNGVLMSLRVARRLASAGIAAQVLDMSWLAPSRGHPGCCPVDRQGPVVDDARGTVEVWVSIVRGFGRSRLQRPDSASGERGQLRAIGHRGRARTAE